MKRALPLVLALAASGAQAQQATMEERLRNQLRITTTQLQQAQNELAALKAGQPQAGAGNAGSAGNTDSASLKKELEATRAQLAAERGAREKLADAARQSQLQGQGVAEKAASQVAQFRGAYDELLRMARGIDAERQKLASEATTQKAALQRCETANAKLYAVGQDILRAYETVDLTTVMASRQPFAAQSRVRYEQIAQDYGDKLYEGRFDANAVPAAETQPAQSASTPTAAAPSSAPAQAQ
nr:hypothetical protein [Cupriavidus sp. SW-Y-13]